MSDIKYIIILQCDIVKERCSGFFCENAFTNRQDCFEPYADDSDVRYISMTCGGCCGRATLRKLSNLTKLLKKKTDITNNQIALHFSSCICKENFHGPKCPHYDYLKELVERKDIQWREGTTISKASEKRRDHRGHYQQQKYHGQTETH
ncbi:MAG: CGGC domain-containing protein [Phycisphaerae bacterium]|nr:CGGC domain-containing protein [Phycisphaerae bacterium]